MLESLPSICLSNAFYNTSEDNWKPFGRMIISRVTNNQLNRTPKGQTARIHWAKFIKNLLCLKEGRTFQTRFRSFVLSPIKQSLRFIDGAFWAAISSGVKESKSGRSEIDGLQQGRELRAWVAIAKPKTTLQFLKKWAKSGQWKCFWNYFQESDVVA